MSPDEQVLVSENGYDDNVDTYLSNARLPDSPYVESILSAESTKGKDYVDKWLCVHLLENLLLRFSDEYIDEVVKRVKRHRAFKHIWG